MKYAIALFSILLIGCMASVKVDKRPNLALPVLSQDSHTNDWVIVDQGYVVNYYKWGFNTTIESMAAEINTNRTVSFMLGGLHSNSIATNSISIKFDDVINLFKLMRDTTNDVIVIDRNMLVPQGDK